MPLDRYGRLLSDDLAGVATALAQAIEAAAVFRSTTESEIWLK
ncbi:MAG: hypothetical protein QOF25_5353 [Mycobacterium sp.]|nr:hypothetical protein [Mycobacterium sp.]